MKAIYFLFRVLLGLLLCYASFVSIYISFFKNRQFDFLTVFFIATLVFFTAIILTEIFKSISVFHLKKPLKLFKPPPAGRKNKSSLHPPVEPDLYKPKQKMWGLLVICLISLLIGFFNVSNQYSRGVELSEISQFDVSFSQNTIEASYRQQQPPLDYYFSAFSGRLFGESKWAVRFHAMFFYLILSLILPLGLYFFCSSLWITAMGTALFLINHVVRLHAVHGRPLCLVLLTGFLFLFFYLSLCKKRPADKQSLFPILASQYLFVMSIGLQPVIFIVALFISSFWLLLDNKKETFKKLFFSNGVTGLLALPFYLNMWDFGQSAYKFKKLSWSVIESYIANLDIFYFLEKYFFTFYEQMSLTFLILVIGWLIVVFIKRSLSKLTAIALFSALLFPLLYDFVFRIFIIWGFNNWYFIVLSLFIIWFFILALKEINDYLSCHTVFSKKKLWQIVFFFLFSALFLWNVYCQSVAIKNETRFHDPYRENSVERVYDYLKERGDPKDIALDFSLRPIVVYRLADITMKRSILRDSAFHPVLISYSIKFTQTAPFFHENPYDRIYYIDWQNLPKKANQKIFFIVVADDLEDSEDKAYPVLSRFMKGQKIGRYAVFELTLSSHNRKKEYLRFLSQLNKETPKKHRGALYETLIYYAYKDNKRARFNRLLQEYRDLEPALDEFTSDQNYPSRFELRRRVKYFENLDWQSK